jgi:riboflavin transporter FmnP
MENKKFSTKDVAKLGILTAIGVVLVYLVHFPIIPSVGFLQYDPADVPILLGTFAMGPVAGLLLTVAVAVIQGLTVSADSGLYGILMHIIATGTYVLVAGLIYKRKKTKKNALFALAMGVVSWVLIMIPANLIVTPVFMNTPVSVIVDILPLIILFNLIKSVANSVLTFILYKRVSGILHR